MNFDWLFPRLRDAREQIADLTIELGEARTERDLADRRRAAAESRLQSAQRRVLSREPALCPECGSTSLRNIYKTKGASDDKEQYQCHNLHNLTVFGQFPEVRVTNSGRRRR